jgi:hypothetical protein
MHTGQADSNSSVRIISQHISQHQTQTGNTRASIDAETSIAYGASINRAGGASSAT